MPDPGKREGQGPRRVAYLLGAGATQGSISHSGSHHSLIMEELYGPISQELYRRVSRNYGQHSGIRQLANEVLGSEPHLDIEQLITFLEDSPTEDYKRFANDLRDVFSLVLRGRLEDVEKERGNSQSMLYAALVDMHQVAENEERLNGFMTLNYDVLLERAIVQTLGRKVNFGIAPLDVTDRHVTVLKMHGSFGWSRNWPIETRLHHGDGFWIPPGIRKPKNDYPFNVIWGRARELLDCDVLRIIGCNLGPNDWDLVSLLFSTRRTHVSAGPYSIELISGFETADRISKQFPYLDVQWLPELPRIGDQIVSELFGLPPQRFSGLSKKLRAEAGQRANAKINNPFAFWLAQMGGALMTDVGDLSTETCAFRDFTETMG